MLLRGDDLEAELFVKVNGALIVDLNVTETETQLGEGGLGRTENVRPATDITHFPV